MGAGSNRKNELSLHWNRTYEFNRTNYPTLEVAMEIQVNRFAVETKYGLQFELLKILKKGEYQRLNEKYFETKLAFKYKFGKKQRRPNLSNYIGLEYFLVSHRYDKKNSWLTRKGMTFNYASANINRVVNGLRIKWDIMFFWKK